MATRKESVLWESALTLQKKNSIPKRQKLDPLNNFIFDSWQQGFVY